MKTAYVTDDFSSLGGLGSVAYGDPEYFREVQNQIYQQSPSRAVDIHRPSDAFESLVGNEEKVTEVVLSVLNSTYDQNDIFEDYIDVEFGPDWRERVKRSFYPLLQRELDSNSIYARPISGYIESVLSQIFLGINTQELNLLSSEIISKLNSESFSGISTEVAFLILSNNPQTKLSNPPPNSEILLKNSVDLGLDYRDIPYVTGYSTLEEYWSDIPYPGFIRADIIPATLKESIIDGYIGYLSNAPLEALYNPIGANSVNEFNLSSQESLNFSDQFSSGSILAQLPQALQGDSDIYSISLIGETLNGYTSFDPKTMSNGDLIDPSLIPDFENQNADMDRGLPGLARTFTPPF